MKVKSDFVLNIYIIYYAILLFFLPSVSKFEKTSLEYYLLLIPVWLFPFFFLKRLLSRPVSKVTLFLLLLIVSVGVISFLRVDIPTAYNVFIFCIPILFIINLKLKINFKALNTLYLFAILGGLISYALGHNDYGIFPGQYMNSENYNELFKYRISIFPNVIDTVFFSLFVLLINYYFNESRNKWIFILISVYFIVFSYSRTVIILIALFVSFELLRNLFVFKFRFIYLVFPFISILIIIMMLYFNSIFLSISSGLNPTLNNYLFRNEQGIRNSQELSKTIYRTNMWERHLQIYQTSPIYGVGTFDYRKFIISNYDKNDAGSGSEGFITGLLARIGLMILPLLFFLVHLGSEGLRKAEPYKYLLPILIILIMLNYGSFMNPYNMMYYIIFGSYCMTRTIRKTTVNE